MLQAEFDGGKCGMDRKAYLLPHKLPPGNKSHINLTQLNVISMI
jgi:hypothetical protein